MMMASLQYPPRTTDLASIWRGLVSGELALLRVTYVGARCLAVLEERAGRRVSMPPSAAVFLERFLSGDSPKVIAFEEDVAIST